MKEELLKYVWQYKLIPPKALKTNEGQGIKIIKTGESNSNAGPDFLNARVKIGRTEWAGNVEMHVRSSDWVRHGHQNDKAYNNTILHVVFQQDSAVPDVPTLELKNKMPASFLKQYQELISSRASVPCASYLSEMNTIKTTSWLNGISFLRLENKSEQLFHELSQTNGDWHEVFYRILLRSFGFKVNSEPFDQLAKALPYKTISKHINDPLAMEALLFGVAGYLDSTYNPSIDSLKKEFSHLKLKYNIESFSPHVWKKLRLRPSNFPEIRLAQLFALLSTHPDFFEMILHTSKFSQVMKIMEKINAQGIFAKEILLKKAAYKRTRGHFGKASAYSILINAIIPSLFIYGKYKGAQEFCDKAVDWLENIPAENNQTTRLYSVRGLKIKNAGESQALLHLNKLYCKNKKCLHCGIGMQILKSKK
ncbi:MAG TPA: DUF2851 family protein [Bacteroidia bacterium]|nr:DUF2851 family protein [Bacteroidia bacterium]HNT79974.1 DUF2851 family protein [Bacteroidia bacterium]